MANAIECALMAGRAYETTRDKIMHIVNQGRGLIRRVRNITKPNRI